MKKKRLRTVESLEDRQLLAGDIVQPIDVPAENGCCGGSGCAACTTIQETALPEGHYEGDGHDHSTLVVLDNGASYYFDPAPDPSIFESEPVDEPTTDVDDDGIQAAMPLDVPVYHSNPSATKKIYLDFDGQEISGTIWNSQFYNGRTIHAPAYSVDNDIQNFSVTELNNIRDIYLRVAEDFSPFNVDVTTEDPGEAVLNSANQAIRVMISTDRDEATLGGTGNRWFTDPAGGVAFLNSWAWNSDTPAWVFENNLGNAKSIAEAASHEVGHAFDLSHDGASNTQYYGGHGSGATSWAPIMGVSYTRTVTQWSRGEYNNANNGENDLAKMTTTSRIPYRVDDHSSATNNVGAATPLTPAGGTVVVESGIIERAGDVDVFSIIATGQTSVDLDFDPAEIGANLDIEVTVYDNSGVVVASNNPTNSLAASLNLSLSPGSYTVAIDGVGKGTASNGWTDYASLGEYNISGTIEVLSPPCGTPFHISGLGDNDRPDFYYTPSTGALVVNTDDVFLNSMTIDGPSPTNEFNDSSWTFNYANGSAEWQLDAGVSPYGGATRIATYATNLDSAVDFSCTQYEYSTVDSPTAQTSMAFTNTAIDATAPTASGTFNNISIPGANTYQFSITYDDNVGVDTASFDGSDVRVTASGFNENATFLSHSMNSDGSVLATYSVPAPGGAWDASDNGTYRVFLNAAQVTDLGGLNASGGLVESFEVSIANTCGTPFHNSGVMGDGFVDYYYTPSTGRVVVDTDDAFVQYMKLDSDAAPSSVEFNEQFWSFSYFNGSAQWFLPPGLPAYEGVSQLATFDAGQNILDFPCVEYGYTEIDDPNAQSFIGYADVSIDDEAPTASATVADIETSGGSTHQFTTMQTDDVALDVDTFSDGDLVVTGPNGYSEPVTLVSSTTNGFNSSDVLYEFPAAGGSWDASDNGTYTISTVSNQVADLGGNQQAGGDAIATFEVNISDGGNPYDLDADGDVDPDDIDVLCLAVHQNGSMNTAYDFNNDGVVDASDFSTYLSDVGTKVGDANFDGAVDVQDFNIWNVNKFSSNDPAAPGVGWATADFNCDGTTDVSDFNNWNANKFTFAARPIASNRPTTMTAATPEVDFDTETETQPAELQSPLVSRTNVTAVDDRIRSVRRSTDAQDVQVIDRVFEWL